MGHLTYVSVLNISMRYALAKGLVVAAAACSMVPSVEAESAFIDGITEIANSGDNKAQNLGAVTLYLVHHNQELADIEPQSNDIGRTEFILDAVLPMPNENPTDHLQEALDTFYEITVSTINESVDSHKLYDIDPKTIQGAVTVLLKDGFTIQGASATVGALMTESRLDPAVSNGHGIAQWQGARLKNVHPLPTDSLEEQIIKMLDEMRTQYENVYADMHDPQASIEQTIKAMHRYEGESIAGRRKVLARTLYGLLQDGTVLALQK